MLNGTDRVTKLLLGLIALGLWLNLAILSRTLRGMADDISSIQSDVSSIQTDVASIEAK